MARAGARDTEAAFGLHNARGMRGERNAQAGGRASRCKGRERSRSESCGAERAEGLRSAPAAGLRCLCRELRTLHGRHGTAVCAQAAAAGGQAAIHRIADAAGESQQRAEQRQAEEGQQHERENAAHCGY